MNIYMLILTFAAYPLEQCLWFLVLLVYHWHKSRRLAKKYSQQIDEALNRRWTPQLGQEEGTQEEETLASQRMLPLTDTAINYHEKLRDGEIAKIRMVPVEKPAMLNTGEITAFSLKNIQATVEDTELLLKRATGKLDLG